MRLHELWFGHPRNEIDLPICKRCERAITYTEWERGMCLVRDLNPLGLYATWRNALRALLQETA
jgi:hypothetical protein